MILLDDTYTDKDFGLKALIEHSHPLNAEIQPKTVKIPGRAGVYSFGDELGSKPFSITFDVIEYDTIVMQQKLYKFISFLQDDFGYPREVKMIYDYAPDRFYMVKLNQAVDPQRLIGISQFILQFVANDPYSYSTVYSDEVTWGNETITFESSYLLGHEGTAGNVHVTEDTTIDLTVSGKAIQPIIEIKGTADNLSLEVNGYSIDFPNFSNTNWVIDCENYTVLKDGVNNFNDVKLRKFILLPGLNSVSITGTNIDIDINFRYRDKF